MTWKFVYALLGSLPRRRDKRASVRDRDVTSRVVVSGSFRTRYAISIHNLQTIEDGDHRPPNSSSIEYGGDTGGKAVDQGFEANCRYRFGLCGIKKIAQGEVGVLWILCGFSTGSLSVTS